MPVTSNAQEARDLSSASANLSSTSLRLQAQTERRTERAPRRDRGLPRACLKNHFRNLQAPLCGIFYPHSVAVARYAALIRIKSPANWDSQLAKSLFQTRSNSHIRVSMFDDRIEILLFILLRTAYWTAFNLPDVEFIVIGRSLTRIPVRYKLIDS